MTEARSIGEALKKSLAGPVWHGPAVFEVLEGVTATQAAARPVENAHTIWELITHLAVWAEVTLARTQGRGPEDVPPEEDWPAMPDTTDETAWRALKERLRRAHDDWYAELDTIDETKLHRPWKENAATPAVMAYGTVQHNAYHAGQIGLLKKAL